jgi:hypothetical protein
MALPGFVLLGGLAVATQLVVIAGVYGYLRYRRPVPHQRTAALLLGGSLCVAFGQLAALGAVGSLRVSPFLSLHEAVLIQKVGLLVAGVGYVGVFAGFVTYSRNVA